MTSDEYIASLHGVNESSDGIHNYTRIVFKPLNMYFKFSNKIYGSFTRKEMQDELTTQVKGFITTEQFKNSFLSIANIRLGFNADPIWIKK